MQTPLQRLIEIIGWRKTAGEELELPDSDPGMIQINLAIRDAIGLLEKEMTVIQNAFSAGWMDGQSPRSMEVYGKSSDYYTKTFTDESK